MEVNSNNYKNLVPETKGASIILLQVLEKLEIWKENKTNQRKLTDSRMVGLTSL